MQKDLGLVLDEAKATHTPLPGSALVSQLFSMLQAQGRGADGTQALVDGVGRLGRPR
jgi:3-hydroxyisobutyrate dehydrogenase